MTASATPTSAAGHRPPAAPSPSAWLPASAAAAPETSSGGTPADATQQCPHCHTINRASDLFCEGCGYDFTTGAMPRPSDDERSVLDLDLPIPTPEPQAYDPVDLPVGDLAAAADSSLGAPEAAEPPSPDGEHGDNATDAQGEDDIPVEDPPEPFDATSGSLETPRAPAPIENALPDSEVEHDDDPADPADPADDSSPATPIGSGPRRKPGNRPPSREVAGDWVVEIWIDPQWYDAQDSDETCPSPAPPDIVRITGSSALIGRRSSSRGVTPDIDCGIDTGVSRRQALLAGDGRRWWIEDLDSANGTYVAQATGPLPTTPLKAGQREEIDAGDRVYLGAWTRLVVRPATESDIAGFG